MAEYLHQTPDGEPYYPVSTNLGNLEATLDNSTVFLHDFENKGADHLFIGLEDSGDSYLGAFIWRVAMENTCPGMFDDLVAEMRANEWDILLADIPGEGDQAAFDSYIDSKVVKVTNKKIYKWLGKPQKGQYL